jgi:thiol-disulfide isomerase/thioredoxin
MSLEETRGRPVILNFWYAACPPCQQEMPLLQGFADSHPDVVLLLVDHQDGAATAAGFAASRHVHAPVLLDQDGRVTAAYRVWGFPTSVFLRPDGTEASRVPRALTEQELAAHMANLGGG